MSRTFSQEGWGYFEKKVGTNQIKSVSICQGHLLVSGRGPNPTFIYYITPLLIVESEQASKDVFKKISSISVDRVEHANRLDQKLPNQMYLFYNHHYINCIYITNIGNTDYNHSSPSLLICSPPVSLSRQKLSVLCKIINPKLTGCQSWKVILTSMF